MQYHHTGVVTDHKQPNEVYVEATKVWVTNPEEHPYRIEFLRFEPDTPVAPPVRDHCHTAYKVEDLEGALSKARMSCSARSTRSTDCASRSLIGNLISVPKIQPTKG